MTKGNISKYETLVHAAAGAAGSVVAMTLMYPLDIVKFRMQLEDEMLCGKTTPEAVFHIMKREGIEGLYEGLKPALTTLGISEFVYFYTFHGLKSLDFKWGSPTKGDLVLSTIAGVVNVFATNPLCVVNSRLRFRREGCFSGLLDGLIHIASAEGIGVLWSSLGSSLLLVSNPAINFTVYEALKRRTVSRTALAFFVVGAVSKAAATVATYPLQVAQTRQRYGASGTRNTAGVLVDILRKGGPAALYQGLEAKLLQTVLSSALKFMIYEKIAKFVFTLLRNNKK